MDSAAPHAGQGSELLPLIAILGPTASGKTALSIRIAEEFQGEILACDSTQVYRGFDAGTAKPAPDERKRVPHHLIDIAEPAETFSAGEYRRRALAVLAELRRRERIPVFTVGTGLYFRALLEGLAEAPGRSRELRERLAASAQRHGRAHLHRMLRRLDAAAAARIAANDTKKIIRALEIRFLCGRPLSQVHQGGREPLRGYAAIKIGLNPARRRLHERIAERTERMLESGWAAEVGALIEKGTPLSAKPFEFIGYGELREYLLGQRTLEEAKQSIVRATRQYAKRQMTWFRKEREVSWLCGFGDDPEVFAAAAKLIRERMGGISARPRAISDPV